MTTLNKNLLILISSLILLLFLTTCGTTPAETTAPPTTAPAITEPAETTVPSTTEPPAPEGFVCVNEMFEGSDITITVEGSDIILEEDGLVLKMSTEHVDVYRDIFIVGVMKKKPIVENDLVYIHGQFYDYFFCKEDKDNTSLFYNICFYPEEARTAIENPDASVFNQKLCAEILLPQSMGITIPHIDDSRIFRDDTILDIGGDRVPELADYGYTETYVWAEYLAIKAGQTLKAAGISDDDITTVGEYERLEKERNFQEWMNDPETEEIRAFLEQKGVYPTDYEQVISYFNKGAVLSASDTEIMNALVYRYADSLSALGKSIYEKYFPSEAKTVPAEISAMVLNLENMSQQEQKEWFFEFARTFRLDLLPVISIEAEPSTDALDYLDWVSCMTAYERDFSNLPREYVEKIVRQYCDVTVGQHRTIERQWIYNEKTQTYTVYPGGFSKSAEDVYFLLNSITCGDGIYTVHTSLYVYYTLSMPIVDQQELKNDLFNGNNTNLIYQCDFIISFQIAPETTLPIFRSMQPVARKD